MRVFFLQCIAVAVTIEVGIHGIYHLACDFPRLLDASSEKYKLMEPFFGDQPSSYWFFCQIMGRSNKDYHGFSNGNSLHFSHP